MDAVVAHLESRPTADADGPGRMPRSSKPKLNGSWQGICQEVKDRPDPLTAPDLLVGRQPDRKRGNVQLRQHRYDRRIRSHQMFADKSDPEAGPDRLHTTIRSSVLKANCSRVTGRAPVVRPQVDSRAISWP